MKKFLFILLFFVIVAVPCHSFAVSSKDSSNTSEKASTEASSESTETGSAEEGALTGVSFDDLAGKTAGVMTGTPQEDFIKAKIDNPNILYFNSMTDLAVALEEKKIDFYSNSSIAYRIMKEQYPDLAYVDDTLISFDIGTIFPKTDAGEKLQGELNEYIAKIKDDGTLDDLKDYWLYPKDWEEIEIPSTGKNGNLTMAAIATMTPFCFVVGEGYGGLDTAVVAGFCKEYGYGLNMENVDFAGALSGVAAGKYDLAAGQISYTDERAESVLYSDFYISQEMVPIVRSEDYADASSNAEDSTGDASQTGLSGEDGCLTDTSFADLKGKTAGVLTGTPQDTFVTENVEDANLQYFNNFTDELTALKEGKIDFVANSTISYRIIKEKYPELSYVNGIFKTFDIGAILPKTDEGEKLRDEMNEYIAKIKEDGTLDQLSDYWLNPNDWEELSIPEDGENGIIKLGANSTMTPFCFVINEGYGGLDMAVIAGFCEEYGYGLSIENVDFAGALSGVAAGKYDLAAGQVAYTDERAESVLYTDFYSQQDIVPFVRTADFASATSDSENQDSFWAGLKKSFQRTLIDENRYKMILSGLGITLVITFFGFLLANVFGALFCAMALSKNKCAQVIADIYSRIMQGTPVVVILMILYYIVFKNGFSGITVASIGFGITSGAYLAQLFYGAIKSVDRGQSEAALAMGFSPVQTFTGIVMPQAIRNMLAGYFSQLISLMKGTAIVGYIAVADLTKSGDIIRSSTFEPFFPLIVVALIYFAVACILLSILKRIQKMLAPKRVKPENGGEK